MLVENEGRGLRYDCKMGPAIYPSSIPYHAKFEILCLLWDTWVHVWILLQDTWVHSWRITSRIMRAAHKAATAVTIAVILLIYLNPKPLNLKPQLNPNEPPGQS